MNAALFAWLRTIVAPVRAYAVNRAYLGQTLERPMAVPLRAIKHLRRPPPAMPPGGSPILYSLVACLYGVGSDPTGESLHAPCDGVIVMMGATGTH
jgi:hypothetical protein